MDRLHDRAMLRVMKALGAVLLLVGIAALGGSSTAATAVTTPSLRAVPAAPVLTLAGRNFRAGERITLTVSADRVYRARARATRHGSFTVRFPRAPRCVVWSATASGSRSGRIRFRSPIVDCRRYVDAGRRTGSAPAVGTGVSGLVTRGPIRPVCVAELPCTGPAPGVTVVISDGQGVVARTITGSDGRFAVYVPRGRYTVTATGFAGSVVSAAAVVEDGAFADVRISIDTGIR
jgi:hypothetical protein